MKPKSLELQKALSALAVSPIFSHMRKVAYTPQEINHDKLRNDAECLTKAEEKRIRKQQKHVRLTKGE